MKSVYFTILISIVFLSQAIMAQEIKKVQEPEYIGVFAFLDSATGNLRALERQTPEQKIKVKAMGFGGGEGFMQIKGEQSPIRYKTDQRLEFVVRVASQQSDPMSLIQFFRFEPKKGMRRMMLAKVGSMGMSSKSTVSQNAISFNVAKYGESSFKVVPANALSPGEYCLSGPGTQDGFCFGIDSAEAKQ